MLSNSLPPYVSAYNSMCCRLLFTSAVHLSINTKKKKESVGQYCPPIYVVVDGVTGDVYANK
jgi:hypothetical protein